MALSVLVASAPVAARAEDSREAGRAERPRAAPAAAAPASGHADAPAATTPSSAAATEVARRCFANPRAADWADELFVADCTPSAPGSAWLLWKRLAQVGPDTEDGPAVRRFIDAAVAAVGQQGVPVVRCPPAPPTVAVRFAALAQSAHEDAIWANLLARLCESMVARPPPAELTDGPVLWAEARWRCQLALARLEGRYSAERQAALQRAQALQAALPPAVQARLLRDPDTRKLRQALALPAAGRVVAPPRAHRPGAR